jgi:hypothetical protein
MTPDDEGGGAGGTDAGGGGGAPAVREIESDYLSSFTSLLERFPHSCDPEMKEGAAMATTMEGAVPRRRA